MIKIFAILLLFAACSCKKEVIKYNKNTSASDRINSSEKNTNPLFD